MTKYNWKTIEDEYQFGPLSIRGIARQHGCSEAAVRKKAKAKGWKRKHSEDTGGPSAKTNKHKSVLVENRQDATFPTFKADGQKRLHIYPSCPEEMQNLFKAFGTSDKQTGELLLLQLSSIIGPTVSAENLRALLPVLQAIGPKDELEGMLAVQMLGVHNLFIKLMVQCMNQDVSYEYLNSKISQVAKLTRTFTTQMEALNKHRGKGKQQMTVKHIHLNNSQAVIASDIGGGGSDK